MTQNPALTTRIADAAAGAPIARLTSAELAAALDTVDEAACLSLRTWHRSGRRGLADVKVRPMLAELAATMEAAR